MNSTNSMRIEDAVLEYQFSIAHLSVRSQEDARFKLQRFTVWLREQGVCEVDGVTVPLIRRYLDGLRKQPSARTGKQLASQTIFGHFETVRTFVYWLVREELTDDRFSKRLRPPRVEQKVIPTLAPSDIRALFKACDQGNTAAIVARDKALLATLLDTGIRASELCSLTLTDVHFTPSDAWLLINGKGAKQREVGLGREARVLLHRYLTKWRDHLAHAHSEPRVFLSRTGLPMPPYKVDDLLYKLRDRAGLPHDTRVGCHVWRHTMARRFMEQQGDIYALSRLLGHTQVSTTQIYLKDYNQRAARRTGYSVLDDLQGGKIGR